MRPSQASLSDWVSVSSASVSSSAPSVLSSVFTLTSNATSSSASSPQVKTEDSGNPLTVQLKKVYRELCAVENRLIKETTPDDDTKILLRNGTPAPDFAHEKTIKDYKDFADICHIFLRLTLSPLVPASVHGLASKCQIPVRLWSNAFHRPLEMLRTASAKSPVAMEMLSEFIYYAYGFYTGLLEEQLLESFKASWLEALGDLARYRMALASHMASASAALAESQVTSALAELELDSAKPARIDDSPSPSIGAGALQNFELEPERERWRSIARHWYGNGLNDTPGTGKLHHHLGLLSRDADGETLQALYHFVKSMTTLHPFPTARESVLLMLEPLLQTSRSAPDAGIEDLFALLHGMLITHIQLDDFEPTLARFLEKLELDGAEERQWIMMAVTNLGALLDYGRATGVLRATGALGDKKESISERPTRSAARRGETVAEDDEGGRKMDVDEPEGRDDAVSPMNTDTPSPGSANDDLPVGFSCAMRLTFSMLSYTLKHPKRKPSPFAPSVLNPYNTVLLTFLSTVLKNSRALAVMERSIPWEDLTGFLCTIPRTVITAEAESGAKLTSSAEPLPEDWCLRGMEWIGRRVYERGFWTRSEKSAAEIDVLMTREDSMQATDDGIIEDVNDEQPRDRSSLAAEVLRRWTRICRAGASLTRCAEGLNWDRDTRKWVLAPPLLDKVERWKREDEQRHEESRRRAMRKGHDGDVDMDVDEVNASDTESSEDDDEVDERVRALRARRRYLRTLRQMSKTSNGSGKPSRRGRNRANGRGASLKLVPGYTVLVMDTNVLLSSLPIFQSLVESLKWTIVVPLAVVTELDGMTANPLQLGETAKMALAFIASHLRSHGASLKVQTSKGNFLSSLAVRSENVRFDESEGSWDRSMDDLILRAALWQLDHWVDRTSLLRGASVVDPEEAVGASRVVLLTFDRNLRLKAGARQLDSADERDIASVLSPDS